MNDSFYVTVATVAPVLLFGTVFTFRVPESIGRVGRLFEGYTLVFALVGILGTIASFLVALYALMEQKQFPIPVDTLMFGMLSWLIIANMTRIIEPLLQMLYVMGQQSKVDRLEARGDRMKGRIDELTKLTEERWRYAATLEAEAGMVGPARRRYPVAHRQTRLLAKRR